MKYSRIFTFFVLCVIGASLCMTIGFAESNSSTKIEDSDSETSESDETELEEEVDDFDSETPESEETELAELEQETIKTDAELFVEVGLAEEEQREVARIKEKIEKKEYVLSRVLKHQVNRSLQAMQTIIEYLESKNETTSNLTAIRNDLEDIYDNITETITIDTFKSLHLKAVAKTQQFKREAQSSLTENEREILKKKIENAKKSGENEKSLLEKLTKLHNLLKIQKVAKNVSQELRQVKNETGRILGLKDSLEKVAELRKKLQENNSFESIRKINEDIKTSKRELKDQKEDIKRKVSALELESKLLIEKRSIALAKKEGLNVTDLETRQVELEKQIAKIRSANISKISKEAFDKLVADSKQKLSRIKDNSSINKQREKEILQREQEKKKLAEKEKSATKEEESKELRRESAKESQKQQNEQKNEDKNEKVDLPLSSEKKSGKNEKEEDKETVKNSGRR